MKFIVQNRQENIDPTTYYSGSFTMEHLIFNDVEKDYPVIDLEEVVELVAWVDGLDYEVEMKGHPSQPDYLMVIIQD